MRTYLALRALASWARPNRWADLRGIDRVDTAGQFAGLAAGGKYHIVELHNWSTEGACIEAAGLQLIGERVKITSAALNHVGRVCWIANGRAGVEFEPYRGMPLEQSAESAV
jgi:hypothetical protein